MRNSHHRQRLRIVRGGLRISKGWVWITHLGAERIQIVAK